jgi:hypothetical protein
MTILSLKLIAFICSIAILFPNQGEASDIYRITAAGTPLPEGGTSRKLLGDGGTKRNLAQLLCEGSTWDNDINPDGVDAETHTHDNLADFRVVDDFTVAVKSNLVSFKVATMNDDGWGPGDTMEIFVYAAPNGGGQPGTLLQTVYETVFTETDLGYETFGLATFTYEVTLVSPITVEPGMYWIGFRFPHGSKSSGPGGSYWVTSTGGDDGGADNSGWDANYGNWASNSYTHAFVLGICPFEESTSQGAGANGDPHFKTWRGKHYDFNGECDLVLLHNAEFESGVGLAVHIRTKIRRDMSYISSAALRIGSDILEVASQGVYWFNGVLKADLPAELAGFAFSHTQPTATQHMFEVHLGGREHIKLKTYKDFVSVLIEQGESEHFGQSVGLMSDFGKGHMIARDGKTVIDDANAFGQDWQVLHTDPSLFQTLRFPQHPNVCTMPTPVQANHLRRRLAETSSVDEAAAEKACEHWGEQGKDDCVFDVLTTGDLEMAMVGAY